MSGIDGTWDCVTDTPMGEQASVMQLAASGGTVTGTSTSMLGEAPVKEGRFDGNTFTWEMEMSMPFPMTLKGEVTVDGDAMQGTVAVGVFGKSAIRGTRRAAEA